MNSRPLYIFLHIPKTAGLTLRYHIRKNFNEKRYLLLAHTLFGLKSYPPPDFQEHKKNVGKYLSSLDRQKKERLDVIFGHYVPYGIHEYFDRPHKYFTIVRNPIHRVVSDYNYKVMKYYELKRKEKDHNYIDRTLLINNKIPDFENWLDYYYATSVVGSTPTMYKLLNLLGYGKEIEKIVNKFYFVGITEKFDEDFLFLCSQLGINKHFLSKNKSKKYFKIGDNDHIRKKIAKRNAKDFQLYDYSVKKNLEFKKDTPGFDRTVRKNKIKRIFTLPFSQLMFAPKENLKLLKEGFL